MASCLDPVTSTPNPVLCPELPRHIQRDLMVYRLGRLVYHQLCQKCAPEREVVLTRQHAAECASIHEIFGTANADPTTERTRAHRGTLVDDRLNALTKEDYQQKSPALRDCWRAVDRIRSTCTALKGAQALATEWEERVRLGEENELPWADRNQEARDRDEARRIRRQQRLTAVQRERRAGVRGRPPPGRPRRPP